MPLIFHWHTNYDNLLKVQHFKDNRSSNLASALLHRTHPVTQRLRIDPQLAANTLDSTLAASRISTSLQRHTRRTLTQLQRVLTLTRHPKPPIRPKTLSTIPGTQQPSIATISMCSRHVSGWAASQVLKTCLERPGTMSRSREGPLRSRMGVTSKITVTYLSWCGVWRHTCSSTPLMRTPSNRVGSLISSRWPSPRTAVLAALPS